MQAAYIERFGDDQVVRVGPRPIPEVGPSQVVIAVHAAAVNPRDWLLRDGRYVFRSLVFGFPKILGSDVAGVVAATGARATRFQPGDAVIAMQTTLGQMGGFAEYMAVHEDAVAHKPRCADHAHSAGLSVAGLTALQALRDNARCVALSSASYARASGGGHEQDPSGQRSCCGWERSAWLRNQSTRRKLPCTMMTYMGYIVQGTLHRFNSVTELVARCHAQFPRAEARTVNERDEFVLQVRGIGVAFDSLIVHFEGSRCYAVMLPSDGALDRASSCT
ncbi:Bifunctional protein: zinc-containing alcohol dehydrogenase [Enhygromyxa salina]|uniref:Bifunctional protein: zinc-containing alcohol dehydrogenase n=2 Tax=Enhygromyxa salina TaxID=215803 RepID=A0A0C2D109_9BACT|nr:Bifunctional protein: zinc-containing alcohol dehydrogenase [Enhygromyxa salina]